MTSLIPAGQLPHLALTVVNVAVAAADWVERLVRAVDRALCPVHPIQAVRHWDLINVPPENKQNKY